MARRIGVVRSLPVVKVIQAMMACKIPEADMKNYINPELFVKE